MKGKREEAEVIVRLDQDGQIAHVSVVSWPSMARKMLRLYGKPLPKSGNQVEYWEIPLRAITFRRLSALTNRAGRQFVAPRRRASGRFEELEANV